MNYLIILKGLDLDKFRQENKKGGKVLIKARSLPTKKCTM